LILRELETCDIAKIASERAKINHRSVFPKEGVLGWEQRCAPRSHCVLRAGEVIAGVWRGWTTLKDADGYERQLMPELLPGLSKVEGFCGSYLFWRVEGEEVEFVTIILWDSIEALRAVTGEDYERAVIPEENPMDKNFSLQRNEGNGSSAGHTWQ
jgi:hypothetical protein